MDVKDVKEQLIAAGIEVYRTRNDEIHVAERVRVHIMDSNIRVLVGSSPQITFTARSQRSDYPASATEATLFARIRDTIGQAALERGYTESAACTTEVPDPQDSAKILDTWHEVTWTKPTADTAEIIDEVKWALGLERYVPPAS